MEANSRKTTVKKSRQWATDATKNRTRTDTEPSTTPACRRERKRDPGLLTAHLTLGGETIPNQPPHVPHVYLGASLRIDGNYDDEKERVIKKTSKAADQLHKTVFKRSQLETLITMCITLIFRYTAAVVPWTPAGLKRIEGQWTRARKYAWKMPTQTASAPFQMAPSEGGLDYDPVEWHLIRELHSHLKSCLEHDDEL